MNKSAYIVETFISLEGEGPYIGYPTVYVRLAGCNLTCSGFNNPNNESVLDFNPKDYTKLKDLPPITRGCDSNYAVSPKFKHLWTKMSPLELLKNLDNLLPDKLWIAHTGLDYVLSITGGEPTIHQNYIIEFLEELYDNEYYTPKIIIIETNATIELKNEFIDSLNNLVEFEDVLIVWSNSLKLSNSNEDITKTINPKILKQQLCIDNCKQYFKFVTDGSDKSIDEIEEIIDINRLDNIINYKNIYLMASACTNEQLLEIGKLVAQQCIDRGYKYSTRLQNTLWDNIIGS
jgi:7-carboxy-7-deazaguanine synthase